MTRQHRRHLTLALCFVIVVGRSSLAAQGTVAKAKDFYASASYEEALQMLSSVDPKASADATEVAAYQVFCLVALGRTDEAKQAVEAIVRTAPLYHPSEVEVSPRVRAFFENTRRPLLPEVVRESYAKAKGAFDRKETGTALVEFDRVIALLDEIGGTDAQGVSDLRTLAAGFRDLSRTAAIPAAPPVVAPANAAPAEPAGRSSASPEGARVALSPEPRVYGPADVAVSRPVSSALLMPPWRPANVVEQKQAYHGSLELLIDETGKVANAVVTKSVHPAYDPKLVQSALAWKFKPAVANGVPVKYRYKLDVHIGAGAR